MLWGSQGTLRGQVTSCAAADMLASMHNALGAIFRTGFCHSEGEFIASAVFPGCLLLVTPWDG